MLLLELQRVDSHMHTEECVCSIVFSDSYRGGGGEGDGGLPPSLSNPPPPLNQHKFYYKVDSSKVTTVAAKRCASVQKYLELFQRWNLAVKTRLVGGGCQMVPPLSKNPV